MAEIEKILCAIDFGPMTGKILDYTKTISTNLDAEIYILYVVHSLDFIEQFSVPQSYREEYEKQITEQANQKVNELKNNFFKQSNTKFIVKTGNPSKVILEFVDKNNIDLIVIGANNKKDISDFLFGSVGGKVIKLSKIPVLVVKS